MKKTDSATGCEGLLPGALRDMVGLAARSLGLSVEIWSHAGRNQERLSLAASCSTCALKEARIFDRCRKRRSYLARNEARIPPQLTEKCPLKLRLARLGPESGESGPVLFAFGYAPPADDVEQDPRVLSFLHDLQSLLQQHNEKKHALASLGCEPASQREEINLLQSVSGKLASLYDLNSISSQVLSEWRSVLNADCGFLWLRDRDILEFSFASAEEGIPAPESRSRWHALARRLAEGFERSGLPANLEHLEEDHPIARTFGGALDCVAVPLLIEGAIRGVLCGLHRGFQESFSTAEVKLLKSLGTQLALAVANAQLYEDLQSFLTSTVKTLVAAIDAKDAYTSGHSERVNIVAMLLGHEMDLDLEDLEALYWSALLHDVGKIGMPEAILNKLGTLDENDVEIVQEHPERGWQLLHPIAQLRRAAEGVRHHHERWDGSGYPLGLHGHDIPIIARLIAVADTFDSIISNRSYRKSRPVPRAVEIIEECAGTQFDPEAVLALRRLRPLLERHQWVLMSGRKLALDN